MQARFILLISGLLLLIWSCWSDFSADVAGWYASEFTDAQLARAGQWGDSFGAFNALTSAAAFTVILATLILQSRAIRTQAADLHRQRFESSFFELLRLMRELRTEITFRPSEEFMKAYPILPKEYRGLEAVTQGILEMVYWTVRDKPTGDLRDWFVNTYSERVYSKSESTIGPYFRIIYTLLDRVRKDKILSSSEKASYGNLLRSQLTSHELLLLAINGLAPFSNDMSELIIRFRMLKYLPNTIMKRRLSELYPSEAFQARD